MPGLTGYAGVTTAIAAGAYDEYSFAKQSTSSIAAATWHDTWADPGYPQVTGATDSGGTQYVQGSGGSGASANKGGFAFEQTQLNVSTAIRSALGFGATANQVITICVYDRLCAIGPITVTATGTKSLTTLPALPRYTSGIGVEAWAVVTTAFATTAGSFFLDSYTGSSNAATANATSSRLATATSPTIKVGDMIGPFPVLSPDVGVKAVASFNVNAAPSAGAMHIVLLKRLYYVSIPLANVWNEKDHIGQIAALGTVADGASLGVMWLCNALVTPTIYGQFRSVYA